MKVATLMTNLAIVALMSGCATAPSQPDWVNGTSSRHPDAQYLTGRGQAPTVDEARDRARADLAKIFEVGIAATSEDTQTYSARAEAPGQYQAQATRQIATRTDQIVRGIQIAELWQDPATRAQHALAVLPRLPAATSLRQEIERLDGATRTYLDQARTSDDLFIKIGAASHALDAQLERQAYQKSLKIVDLTGRGVEPEWNSARLAADLADLLKRVRMATRVPAQAPAGFAEVVNGAVAAAGFMIETGDKPDFLLDANLTLQDLGLQEGWYWQRGTLEVRLTETAGNRVRGSQRWPIKSSARDQASSQSRALDEADKLLKNELRAAIVGFATAKPK
ncbi:MAG: LPP20 family lipoprotein [Chromatiales bacterium]|nr:LPP20 family lipoprotein [Chromatiales bacterium]